MSISGRGLLAGVESTTKKVLIGIGAFLLATLIVCVPVGVLGSSNIVWGEGDQYGRVDVPGTATLHLPERTVDVRVALDIPGKGNQTVDVPLPDNLALTITPVGGGPAPTITRDVGISGNALTAEANSQVRVWRVDVPSEGDYQVRARGRFVGIGINPQLWFGHGPPIPGTLVPLIAALIVALGALIWFVVLPRVRGPGKRLAGTDPDEFAVSLDSDLNDAELRGLGDEFDSGREPTQDR